VGRGVQGVGAGLQVRAGGRRRRARAGGRRKIPGRGVALAAAAVGKPRTISRSSCATSRTRTSTRCIPHSVGTAGRGW
jgi:hypothetical protein